MLASRSVDGAALTPRHGPTWALGATHVERPDRERVGEPLVAGEEVGERPARCCAHRASLATVIVLAGAFFQSAAG